MLTRAAQRSRLELSVCYYRAWTPLWAPYCMVLSARVYSHLVIDYDANMSGLCQLHGSVPDSVTSFFVTSARTLRSALRTCSSVANMDLTAFSSLAFAALGLAATAKFRREKRFPEASKSTAVIIAPMRGRRAARETAVAVIRTAGNEDDGERPGWIGVLGTDQTNHPYLCPSPSRGRN